MGPIRLISGRKKAFLTEIPLQVNTVARGRNVSGRTKILRNTYSAVELIGMAAASARNSSSDDVFSEESDLNTLMYMTTMGITQNL